MSGRVLILGVTGMLGHEVFRYALEHHIDAYATARRPLDDALFPHALYPRDRVRVTDPSDEKKFRTLLDELRPSAVVNCIGAVKQAGTPDDAMWEVNGKLPHRLAAVCAEYDVKLIQVSTDCVFSGKRGKYGESDTPDPVDSYGESKLAGEVGAPHLTVRTSIIGLELGTHRSLLGWFLNLPHGAHAKGYTRAIWSGLATSALAPLLLDFAVGKHAHVTGLLHVAGEPINKYDLLCKAASAFHRTDIAISPQDEFVCDRSMVCERLPALGIRVPSVDEMLRDLASRKQ